MFSLAGFHFSNDYFHSTMTIFKQPLVQFLLLGLMIFGLDHAVNGYADDPHQILIDDSKYAEIAGIFQDNQGRSPNEKEMRDLTIKWAQNEVLYREARLMGLDKGDEMIRNRLVLKMRNVVFGRLSVEPLTAKALHSWFIQHRTRYDKPATFSFEQFRVGDRDSADVAAALATKLGATLPSEYQQQIHRYERRPLANIEYVFGKEQADQLVKRRDRSWMAVSSPAGWHLARIVKRYPAVPAVFEDIRVRVAEDWKKQASDAQLAETLHEIASTYHISVELTNPPENWDTDRINAERLAMESHQ